MLVHSNYIFIKTKKLSIIKTLRRIKMKKKENKIRFRCFFSIFLITLLISGNYLFSNQTINLETPKYSIHFTPEGYHKIALKGFYSYGIPGYPDLPSKIYRIALPPHSDLHTVTIETDGAESVSLGTYDIQELPAMATWIDGEKIISDKPNLYSNDAYYPEKAVEFLGTSQMRKWRILNIKYNPFQYNPVTKDLCFISNVTVTIRYTSHGMGAVSEWELSDTVMDERAQKILHNFSESKAFYIPPLIVPRPSQTHNFVIITTNSIVSSSTKLTDFTNYLTSKGYSPLVITEDDYGILTGQPPNGTAEKIRQWLINNYLSYSIEYVLLIGNPDPSGDVPMKMCWPRRLYSTYRESPTDYFYADLTGDWDLDGDGYFGEYPDDDGTGGVDFANEVYVGRIPVYSGVANLDSVLTKTINYGNSSSITWRKNALLPMSYSDPSTDGANLSEYMKSDYLTPAGISTWTLYMQGSVCAQADSSFTSDEELLDGATQTRWTTNPYGMVWWWGHGNSTTAYLGYDTCGWGTIMSTSDSASLNDGYPSFVYQCSCDNGYPENASNLGTALLYNGAITTVSSSRVSWYAVTSWTPGLKYYCDNASIGYYYGKELVSNSKKAAAALYDVKSDMGANHYTSWGGSHWMNLFDFNLYGNPITSLDDQNTSHTVSTPSTPDGPSNGNTSVSYMYTTGGSSCSQGHSVEYRFDWDDTTYSSWSSSTSGSHAWSSADTYQVRSQARCSVNNSIVSSWSSAKTVTISGGGPAPEINIKKDTTDIPDGGSYDFGYHQLGESTDATFYIENLGTANLELYGNPIVSISGPNADQYSVQQQPTTPITPGNTTMFIIRFASSSEGLKIASISISNNDSDENSYTITMNGTGFKSFYVLDGYGGVHSAGTAPVITPKPPYFGWDIARDMEITSTGDGLYVLDGYGGVHSAGTALVITPKPPYFGWDIARDMEITSTGDGLYVLDGYGGIHSGGTAPVITPKPPYFGWDIARDMEFVISD
jgi:hypothetical protein